MQNIRNFIWTCATWMTQKLHKDRRSCLLIYSQSFIRSYIKGRDCFVTSLLEGHILVWSWIVAGFASWISSFLRSLVSISSPVIPDRCGRKSWSLSEVASFSVWNHNSQKLFEASDFRDFNYDLFMIQRRSLLLFYTLTLKYISEKYHNWKSFIREKVWRLC